MKYHRLLIMVVCLQLTSIISFAQVNTTGYCLFQTNVNFAHAAEQNNLFFVGANFEKESKGSSVFSAHSKSGTQWVSFRVNEEVDAYAGFTDANNQMDVGLTALKYGVYLVGNEMFPIQNNQVVTSSRIILPVNALVELKFEGSNFNVYVDGKVEHTESFTTNAYRFHISLLDQYSVFRKLRTSELAPIQLNELTQIDQTPEEKGRVAVTVVSASPVFYSWTGEKMLSQNEFEQQQREGMTYSTYRTFFEQEEHRGESGLGTLSVFDENGNSSMLSYAIHSQTRAVVESEIQLNGTEISRTTAGTTYTNAHIYYENLVESFRGSQVNIDLKNQTSFYFGVSDVSNHQPTGLSLYKAAFENTPTELRVYVDGQVVQTFNPASIGDFLSFSCNDTEIRFSKNGKTLYTAPLSSPLKGGALSGAVKFGKIAVNLFKANFWPTFANQQQATFCGKTTVNYTTKMVSLGHLPTQYMYGYTWMNEQGTIMSNSPDLSTTQPGVYTISIQMMSQSGLVLWQLSSGKTVFVGYKPLWDAQDEVVVADGGSEIKGDLSNAVYDHFALSNNVLNPTELGYVYFNKLEYLRPNLVQAVGYVNHRSFFSGTTQLNLVNLHALDSRYGIVLYGGGIGTNNYYIYKISNGNSVSVANGTYTLGDPILVKIDQNGEVTTKIGNTTVGIPVTFPNAKFKVAYAANTHSGVLNLPSYISTKLEDVVFSFPCKEIPYAELKRSLDAGYYPARAHKVRFRYDEDYQPLNGELKFKIYNKQQVEVLSANNISISLNIKAGDNKLELDLSPHVAVFTAGFYVLEVTNDKNEKRFLRFKLY